MDNAANLRNTPQRSASGTFNHHSNIGKAGGYGASPSMAPGLRFPSTTSSASAHSLASTGSPTATASVAKGGMTVAGGGIRGDVGGAGGSSLLGESGEWKPPKRVGRDPRYPVRLSPLSLFPVEIGLSLLDPYLPSLPFSQD